jgi:hypothetical protein
MLIKIFIRYAKTPLNGHTIPQRQSVHHRVPPHVTEIRCQFFIVQLFAAQSSCSSIGKTSNSLCIILSNSSLSIPDARANRNKLLMSVLICCLIACSA